MADVNRRYLLRKRPNGRIDDSTFELVEEAMPEPGAGQALVQNLYVSIDPTNRAWIGEEPTYLPPVGIGDCMRSVGLGRVISSDDDDLPGGFSRDRPHRLAGLCGDRRRRTALDARARAWTSRSSACWARSA